MRYIFNDKSIYYEFVDTAADVTTVLLHGWGCSLKSLKFCEEFLENQNLLFVDFPPFGESDKSIEDWTIFTYANMVISLCEHLGLKNINLVGHSFGGRVAIIISVLRKTDVQKLVLVDSAGIKPRRSFKFYWRLWKYKLKKKLGKDVSNCGSADYRALDEGMKKVFNNIVNTHLEEFLPLIEAQTLIVFGEQDKVTPVYMAKILNKKIKNSRLEILQGAGHFCFDDRRVSFVMLLQNFLN